VVLISKFLEMGQGVHSGIATLLAEELDADFSRIRIEAAPVDPRYKSAIQGFQATGASCSMAESWTELRQAGATARAMLVKAAADRWAVAPGSIAVAEGVVSHPPSGRCARFGDLAEAAAALPVPADVPLKAAADFRLIGKSGHRIDSRAKSEGSATFAADMAMDGLKVAVVAHPPRFGATVATVDDSKARAVPGVIEIVRIPTGVAVIARSFWTAKKGRDALVIGWDESKAETRSSAQIMESYRALAATPGAEVKNKGDAIGAMAGAAKRVIATSELPYLAHAAMEPIACVAALTADRCEIWAGTQVPSFDQKNVATLLGFAPEQVAIHTLLAGGSFGRRSVLSSDYICEAVEILKARPTLSPIRLQWTREDEFGAGFFRPMFLHRIEGGLDAGGRLVAWHHRIVGQPLFPRPDKFDFTSVEGAESCPYAVPQYIDIHSPQVGVPIWAWRAVGNTHSCFAIETALDEFAFAGGQDPVAFRRAMLQDEPHMLAVLDLATRKAGWGRKLGKRRGQGFAMHKYQGTADLKGPYGSYVAQVAEVTVAADGSVKVDRVVCAIYCGTVINPEIVRDQVESSIAFGLGAALTGQVTLVEGRVEQNNFDGYPVLRMNEMPKIEVHVVPSTDPPRGVGEPAVPVIAPAVANAIFAATARRIRALPIQPLTA